MYSLVHHAQVLIREAVTIDGLLGDKYTRQQSEVDANLSTCAIAAC